MASAAEGKATLSFIEQVEAALNTAKQTNKLLLVLCERLHSNSESLSREVWNDSKVIDAARQNAVCLLIREQTLSFQQFTVLYPVIAFPTVYVIHPSNGQVLQCLFRAEQLNVDAVIACITECAIKLKQQRQLTQPPEAPKNAGTK